MTDRPIIFSAPMIKALLAGTKTQTRRLIAASPEWALDEVRFDTERALRIPLTSVWFKTSPDYPSGNYRAAIRYAPGDRLWVREAIDKVSEPGEVVYRADYPGKSDGLGWRPSIHMPRWASRLTLAVTDVRVQRLQGISDADAMAEGATRLWQVGTGDVVHDYGGFMAFGSPVYAYATLWDSLHGTGSWDANPWVVAVSFTVQRGNIDEAAQ